MSDHPGGPIWPRRRLLSAIGALGAGSIVFKRALATLAEDAPTVTTEMIRQAEWISGIGFTDEERQLMLEDLRSTSEAYAEIRAVPLDNSVPPALLFDVAPGERAVPSTGKHPGPTAQDDSRPRPAETDELAFLPVHRLASLIRRREISSVELTRISLDRLKRFDPTLRCVITLTEDLALEQAERADREIAADGPRGPLHGIPWGVKDLFAVPGYPTTWGATPFKDQVLAEKATVVSRLERAGATLVAKLSLGALAWGDVWFDAMTRNPWNAEQGSSGSSAGSAAATSAGLVAFAIGTETWGSIVSPCTRCGVTGLRPTFGRVSRHGAMALSWSMDKVGPIARSAEDCALVFGALLGADRRDASTVDRPFEPVPESAVKSMRVGFVRSLFENDRTEGVEDDETRQRVREWQAHDRRTLAELRGLGIDLVPIELPDRYPVGALSFILTAEASAAFDELTRSGRDDLLVRQVQDAWPNVFRQGQLIPAVEYIRANRVRTLIMREMETTMSDLDAYVAPSYGGDNLLMTNLTGHPAVVLPNGFRESDGTPTSISFTGRLFGEDRILALARAYQQATDYHSKRPPLEQ